MYKIFLNFLRHYLASYLLFNANTSSNSVVVFPRFLGIPLRLSFMALITTFTILISNFCRLKAPPSRNLMLVSFRRPLLVRHARRFRYNLRVNLPLSLHFTLVQHILMYSIVIFAGLFRYLVCILSSNFQILNSHRIGQKL